MINNLTVKKGVTFNTNHINDGHGITVNGLKNYGTGGVKFQPNTDAQYKILRQAEHADQAAYFQSKDPNEKQQIGLGFEQDKLRADCMKGQRCSNWQSF